MPQVREYETLYIIVPNLAEDEQKNLVEALAGIVKKAGGELVKNDVWGKRKLAYPIKKSQEGIYVLLRYKAGASVPSSIDTYIKRTPDVLRHLTTVVTKQQLKEEERLKDLEAKRVEAAKKAAEEAAKREAEEEAKAAKEAEATEPVETATQEIAPQEPAVAEETPLGETESSEPEAEEASDDQPAEEASSEPEEAAEESKEAIGE